MSFHGRHHGFVSLFHVFVWDTKAGQVDGMEECQLALWCLSAEVCEDGFSELKPFEFGKNWENHAFLSFLHVFFPETNAAVCVSSLDSAFK